MKKLLLIALVMLACTSCATILCGTKDRVTFDSEMRGTSAKMIIDGRMHQNVTFPYKVKIKRGFKATEVRISAEGYEPQTLYINKSFNAWAILNLADIAGWAIDAATGAITKPASDHYWIDFTPVAE